VFVLSITASAFQLYPAFYDSWRVKYYEKKTSKGLFQPRF